jgi:ABC-type uncharacterized transport system permease subunit
MNMINHWANAGHMLTAVLTAIAYAAACMLALLLTYATRHLHNTKVLIHESKQHWTQKLPPILTLERWLVQLHTVAFAMLSALILTGMLFGEFVWGSAFKLNHKTLFTLIGWALTAVLLVGRYRKGWRGHTLVRYTIISATLLFLAYVGTHFVLDVVLQKPR